MVSDSSVSGKTILEITSAPGAAIKLAVNKYSALAPMLAYTIKIPPAIQARLPLMLASSSLFVIPFKYGRIITCASTCPTKALATLLSASAPLTRMMKFMAFAMIETINCITPKWYKIATSTHTNIMVAVTLKANTKPPCPKSLTPSGALTITPR